MENPVRLYAEAYRVPTVVNTDANAVVRNISLCQGFDKDGVQMLQINSGFDESKYLDYLADGRAHFSLTSGDSKQETKLTKKAGNDSNERVPDSERQVKLDKALAELKFELGLTKEHYVNYRINSRIIEVYDEQKKLIGKYNLRDKGTFEPNGPIQGSGGIQQLWRVIHGGRGTSTTHLQNLLEKIEKIDHKMKEIVEPETGSFKNVYSLDENFGAVNGHQALSAFQSPEAHKLLTDKDGSMNAQNLKELGYIVEVPSGIPRTKYTLTDEGKNALKQIRRAKLLQGILLANLQEEISNRKKDILAKSPPASLQEEATIKTKENEIKELEKVYREINGLIRSDTITHRLTKDETFHVMPAVTLPIFLMNQTFKIKVPKYQVNENGAQGDRYEKENNQIKMEPKEFKFENFNKPAGLMVKAEKTVFEKTFNLKANSDDAEIDAFREKLIDTAIRQSVHKVRRLIGYDPSSRHIPDFWNKGKTDWKEGDEQLATDIGGLMHQMLAESSQSSSAQKHIDFTENQIGNRMAHESRGAAFLGATVLRGPVPQNAMQRGEQRLCGFRNANPGVQKAINAGLDQYETCYRNDDSLNLQLNRSFNEGELSEFFQTSIMAPHPTP